jgi:hypothetical protein
MGSQKHDPRSRDQIEFFYHDFLHLIRFFVSEAVGNAVVVVPRSETARLGFEEARSRGAFSIASTNEALLPPGCFS